MAFSTWTALKTSLLDAIADGSILTSSYAINGRSHSFRSLDEAMRFIQFCDQQIAAESGPLTSVAEFVRPGVGLL